MKTIKVEIIGGKELAAMLASAGERAVPAIKQALSEEGQLAFRESQRLVPVDTGTLRRSGQILPPKENAQHNIELVMGYGGAAKAYALRQHEDLDYKHKEGKQAKYLEEPVKNRQNKLAQNIQARMKRILSK